MRLFESLLLISLAAFMLFLPRRRLHPLLSPILSVISSVLVLIHLLVEGPRWQLAPAYALVVIVYLWGLVHLLRPRDAEVTSAARLGRLGLALAVLAGLLVVVASAAAAILLPVFRIPEPSGPYAVGTTTLVLTDEGRLEDLTETPDDRRELLVQVWYPATPDASGELEPYWREASRNGALVAGILGLPNFLFNHIAHVQTNSLRDAPVAADGAPFPVLVFSHGYTPGYVNQNTAQTEALASYGYVVFSIAHTYETLAVSLPDGRFLPYSRAQREAFGADNSDIELLLERARSSADLPTARAALRQSFAAMPVINASLERWAADTTYLLDELPRLDDESDRFFRRLDLDRLGLWGMSFGGATAMRVCVVDPRCKAAANLDGFEFGRLTLDQGLAVPSLTMYSQNNDGMNRAMLSLSSAPTYELTVAGSTHYNYMDFTLASPLFSWIGFLGSIDGAYMSELTTDYVRAFFDQSLRGRLSPMLTGPSADYPEVQVVAGPQ